MTRLLLVEDVFLLGHDDESGRNTASVGLQGALAGALLLDLAEQTLVVVDDGRVRATGATSASPLLERAAGAVRTQAKEKKVLHWLAALPRALKPFERTIGESLVERGVLGEEHGKVLGLFSTTRWPERDPQPEAELRAELRETLLGETEPSGRVLLLAGLLDQYGMVDRLVGKPDRKQARARAQQLAKLAESTDAISQAMGESVRAAQAAMMGAIVASTVATTTTAATS